MSLYEFSFDDEGCLRVAKSILERYAGFGAVKINSIEELKIIFSSNLPDSYFKKALSSLEGKYQYKLIGEENDDMPIADIEDEDDEDLDWPNQPLSPKIEVEEKEDLSDLIDRLLNLKEKLLLKVKGQEQAIDKFIAGLFSKFAFLNVNPRGLNNTFLFLGPSGCGKTYLAEIIATELKLPLYLINMSEYVDTNNSIEKFAGYGPSWKGPREGEVTGKVAKTPKCVLVFDEVEKCASVTKNLFLQLYNDGYMRDFYLEEDVSFKDAIIIFTSNACKDIYDEAINDNLSFIPEKKIINALISEVNENKNPIFPQALISRFASGNIVLFNRLDAYSLNQILKKETKRYIDEFKSKFNVNINVSDDVISSLLYINGGKSDARSILKIFREFIIKELNEAFRQITLDDISNLKTVEFNIDKSSSNVDLFDDKKIKVVIIANDKEKNIIKDIVIDNIEYVFADTINDAKDKLRGKVDLVLLDIEFNTLSKNEAFDLEDVNSEGRELLSYMNDAYSELPIYFINNGKDEKKYESLLKLGRGLVRIDNKDNFINDIIFTKQKAIIAINVNELTKTNKLLNYRTRQFLKNKMLIIEMYNLELKTNYNLDDSEFVLDIEKPNIRFDDVIGSHEAKELLKEFMVYLKDPLTYLESGIKPPRGLLLYGPPGTGKTFLAKALASEANVSFIQKNGADFVGKDPNEVSKLFKTARKYAPTIIFIDEVDAIAKERMGISYEDAVLNKFLSEIEGFQTNVKRPVLVICATNFDVYKEDAGNKFKVLDPAFVRRFDKKIKIDLPNKEERIEFINYFLKKRDIIGISNSQIEEIANRTLYYSPSDLENLIANAIRYANGKKLTGKLISESIDANRYGKEHKHSNLDIKRTAIHEAGHALVCYLTGEVPAYLTVVSRGDYGGYMSYGDTEKSIYTKNELLNRIATSLGGRAAEIVMFGEEEGITTGPQSDILFATSIAKDLITKYGMSSSIANKECFKLNELELLNEVDSILKEELDRAINLIRDNKNKLNKLVNALIEKNSLNSKEIINLIS